VEGVQVDEDDDLADIPIGEDWPVAKLVNVGDVGEEGAGDRQEDGDIIVRTYDQK
jgi:hypothetical protein